MAIVVFDSDDFLAIYPRFVILSVPQLQNLFDIACLYLDNSDASIVPYDPPTTSERKTLLYMLMCHIGTVSLWPEGVAGPAVSAARGSVNASFAVPDVTTASWFKSSPCGQMYWQATRKYVVGGHYVAQRYYHPWG